MLKAKSAERNQLLGRAARSRGAGKTSEAIAAGEKALAIERELFPQPHDDLALILDWLGETELERENFPQAETRFQEALAIRTAVLGAGHWKVTHARLQLEQARLLAKLSPQSRQDLRDAGQANSKLAQLYGEGQNQAAVDLADKCRAIRLRVLGETHPDYAWSLHNLAGLYQSMGNYARAEPLYRQALEIKKILGETHPDYATSLNNLAFLYQSMGDYARAEPRYREAAAITLKALEQSFLGESQRQQLAHAASVRFMLDSYLALEARQGTDGQRVYPFWLEWKGLVLRQQLRQHALADRPELKPKFADLEQVTTQLARLALTVPPPQQRDAIQRQLAELSGRKEQLERELAHQSAAFAAAAHAATIEELQQALPAEAVLVDFVEYWQRLDPEKKGGKPAWRRQLAAFILRRAGPIRLVSLGESGSVAEAIDRWRGEKDDDFGRSAEAQSAAKLLRERVWQPLESLLEGAKLVLVSPDGPLDRLPFNAMPGKEAGHYLLEDWALAVVPSPAALAQPALKPATPPEGNLLVVADVDYNLLPSAGPSQPAPPPVNEFADFKRPGRALL